MTEAPAAKRIRVVAAVVHDGDRLLMTQRPPGGPLGLKWEFPGGKLEPGESPEAALVREVHEELGVRATTFETLATHAYDYPHVRVEIIFIRCTLESHTFTANAAAVHAHRWIAPADVRLADVLEGDHAFLRGQGARD